MIVCLAALLLTALPAGQAAPAQPDAQPTITFHFSNPALQPPAYTLEIHEDGTGRYQAGPSGSVSTEAQPPRDQAISLTDPLRAQLFQLARRNHLFATQCSIKGGQVAFTGDKTFSFQGPEGSGSCTFNYSRNTQLQAASGSLIAVANTLEEGRKLELLLAHDKLGLDAEMEALITEQADGRAQDFQNIAPVLQAIAGNEEVLHRTRTWAQQLLSGKASMP